MRHYTQLTQEARYQIYALKRAGHSGSSIAEVLEVHKSTVSRELRAIEGNVDTGRSKRMKWQ